MADQPVTREKLINADIDVDNLGKAVNELGVVNPRYGDTYKTLPQIASEYEQNGATRGFNTLVEFEAVKATIPAHTVVTIGEAGPNQGQNFWNGTTLTKSAYDSVEIAKANASAKTNVNIYRGNTAYIPQYNIISFDKTTLKADYSPAEIRYKGMNINGGVSVPFNGELRSNLAVWVKVKSAALNAGTNMRFLVQAVKQDNTTFLSAYGNIADGATGWVKLAEVSLSEANRAVFRNVSIQPQVTGGADLVVEDFYIGESNPNTPSVRVNEPKNVIVSRAVHETLLPHWSRYPAIAGVTYNANGDITVAGGVTCTIELPVKDVQRLHYCGYLDQLEVGDCRFYWRGYRKGTSTFHDVPYYVQATQGSEFSNSVVFDAVIDRVRLEIRNLTAAAITVRSFDVCYSPVAVNQGVKLAERYDEAKLKSEIIQSVTASKPYQNLSTFPNFETVAKDENGKRFAGNGALQLEYVRNGNIKPNTRYYISLPDAITTLNGGTAKLTVYHNNAAGASLGGESFNFVDGNGLRNAYITTNANTFSVNMRFDLTGGATVELGRVVLSEVRYADDIVFEDYFSENNTGTVLSSWQYPQLSGFAKQGLAVDYQTLSDNGDTVLEIPNTAAGGSGQGLKWIVDIEQGHTTATLLSFMLKLNQTTGSPITYLVRYFREGSGTEISAISGALRFNRDNTWTLNTLWIPAQVGGYDVKYIELFIYLNSTATAPLQFKRFIQSVGVHNPFVKFIKYSSESQGGGFSDYLRLTDALADQPQGPFSVGRQIFTPTTSVQSTLADYNLISGNSLLPKRLNNLRYIDSDGYLIAFIDYDDSVYLRKGTALYKTTVDDLNGRCTASSTVGSEKRGVFNSSGLTVVNPSVPSGWLRVAGDGTMVIVSRAAASYSVDGGATWVSATGYQDVKGEHYNAWGTDVSDNIVLTSGYKLASEGRGTGRVNFSSDFGKTYKTLLDIETSPFLAEAQRSTMHIHAVKYDPWIDAVWVVMGDGSFNLNGESFKSNIWLCKNPSSSTPIWQGFDTQGQSWVNEQHVAIYPMQDCILFGSDANPTGIYRMSRTNDPLAYRDQVVFIHSSLTHYGCGGYRHAQNLPLAIYYGKASEYAGTDINDKVFLTYDGASFVEIYTEPLTSNTPSGKVNAFAYALDNYFIFERRSDQRFASGNTWIVGDIKYMR